MKSNSKDMASKKLLYFGHNRNDVALIRRIQSFSDAGLDVTAFTYRRDGETENTGTAWLNIDLGYIEHARLNRRILSIVKSAARIIKHRRKIKKTDIIYARNLDIFILAWFAKILTPFNSCIMVYECLDVHEALTRETLSSKILRWVERRVLNYCNLLVVSSPGFITNYFEPVQKYYGHYFLVENKLRINPSVISRPKPTQQPDRPIKLVWAGMLRCQKTLDLMKASAKALDGKLDIHFWGKISEFLIPDFLDQIKGIHNIKFHGSYNWPNELVDVYKNADLAWSQELSWSGHNSDWLIPNRIYEASYFSALSLSVNGTQTAKYVISKNIGYSLANSNDKTLIDFISQIDPIELLTKRIALFEEPVEKFITTDGDVQTLISEIMNSDRTFIPGSVVK